MESLSRKTETGPVRREAVVIRPFVFLVLMAGWVHAANIQLGIDVLRENGFKELKGKKVGLVVHPASIDSRGVATLDVIRNSGVCQLVALFGPEHGVYGDEYAGVKVPNRKDPRTGIAIHSLYGSTRKPTSEMLEGLDVLVFDLQDIGSRSYTFISSMKNCLQACAEKGITFLVLDRPNPLGGERVEGPPGVKPEFDSFVGALDVPYLHGMTMGELAYWVQKHELKGRGDLKVIRMNGWKRSMSWSDTGLNWVPTSPHIPDALSCEAYATTGILGELGQVNIGVGYTLPFRLAGMPGLSADALATALQWHWPNASKAYQIQTAGKPVELEAAPAPRGLTFRPTRFKPFYATYQGKGCEGVQIYIDLKENPPLVEVNFRLLEVFGAKSLFANSNAESVSMFDKVCGTDEPRKRLIDGKPLDELFAKWRKGCEDFRSSRKDVLIYE